MPTQPIVESTFESPGDGTRIVIYSWGEELQQPRGVVHIAHGLAEHGARYDRLARALVAAGYRVLANDHRGHGKSAVSDADLGRFGEPGFSGVAADIAAFGGFIHRSGSDPR